MDDVILLLNQLIQGEKLVDDDSLLLIILVLVEHADLLEDKDFFVSIVPLLLEGEDLPSEVQDLPS